MIRAAAGKEEACAALIEAWSVDRHAAPARSRIMLAATRADVRALNELARERLQEEGLLGRAEVIETARGSRSFAAGDRVLFLQERAQPGGEERHAGHGGAGGRPAAPGAAGRARVDGG